MLVEEVELVVDETLEVEVEVGPPTPEISFGNAKSASPKVTSPPPAIPKP